jgi:hypothetical protein
MKTQGHKDRRAFLRFYEELNELLPTEHFKREFVYSLESRMTVRELLRKLRIPVSAVDLVLANGDPVGLSHVVRDDERLSFYPVFEAFDIAAVQRIRRRPLRRVKFVVDPVLKPLAFGLTRLGFDAVVAPEGDSVTLAGRVAKEGRIYLTRSSRRIRQGGFSHALCIKRLTLQGQLAEVLHRLQISAR